MAGIAIADECLVMASAGAKRSRPALMAVVLGIDISSSQKIILFFPVDAGRHITQDMLIRIDKAVAGRDVPRRANADHAQPGATGKRFVYPLVQLRKRVADVGETVVFAA